MTTTLFSPTSSPAPTASTRPLVAIQRGGRARVAGLPVHERNRRAALRAGAHIVEPEELERFVSAPAILVPADVLVDVPLFTTPVPGVATSVGSSEAAIVAGPAYELARFARDRSGVPTLPRLTVSSAAVADAATARGRRRTAWRILLRTAKPTDGWVARHFNRPISRLVSFVLLSVGLSASHASLLTLGVGIAAAILAASPGYAALVGTGLLFHLASVLDGVDGEMARATFSESEAGAELDARVDQLTYLACFVGLVIGWGRQGGGAAVLVWGVIIAIGLVLSLVRGGRFVSRYAPNASFVFIDRSVRRAARESGRPVLKLAAAGFALLRRDLFAIVFLGVSLTGRRELVPALVVGGIVLANVTFSCYRRELAAAALLENPPRT